MIVYIVTFSYNDIVFGKESAQFFPLDEYKDGEKIIVEVTKRFPENFKFYNLEDGKVERKSVTYIYRSSSHLFKDLEKQGFDLGISLASFYKVHKKSSLENIPKEGVLIYEYKNVQIKVYDV